MGVPMRKSPLDAWILQEIVHDVAPDVVVEIGSYAGGSTLYFAHLLDLLGAGEVVSIDVDRSRWSAGDHSRIRVLTGNSSDAGIQAAVAETCSGRRVLICHDGDHTRAQVLRDLRDYADLVSLGSYFVVEDGIVDLFPVGTALHPEKFLEGPLGAIDDFLASDTRFRVDEHRERFGVTWNPRGYLERIA
jgi:cephalosporin hydroxylase